MRVLRAVLVAVAAERPHAGGDAPVAGAVGASERRVARRAPGDA